ncbi:succinate dehydrogenase, cytochrome b556 subunit [Pseudomonadota bacterium]
MQQKVSHRTHPAPLSPRLSIYRWHIPMIASIAHRASGAVLVLFVPFYLWVLHGMTGSPEDFDQALLFLHSPLCRVTLWMAAVAFIYHFCNGIRFLILDAGWCESKQMMRLSAYIVLLIAMLSALAFGWLLW